MNIESERYPIGTYRPPEIIDESARDLLLLELERIPDELAGAVEGLTDVELNQTYRPGGWSLRQVVHHIADAQVHAYIRFKLALAEHEPTVHVWDENAWAALPDASSGPIDSSLALVAAVHARWVLTARSMPPDRFQRVIHHPERGPLSADELLSLSAWHGRHHVAQILAFRERAVASDRSSSVV